MMGFESILTVIMYCFNMDFELWVTVEWEEQKLMIALGYRMVIYCNVLVKIVKHYNLIEGSIGFDQGNVELRTVNV